MELMRKSLISVFLIPVMPGMTGVCYAAALAIPDVIRIPMAYIYLVMTGVFAVALGIGAGLLIRRCMVEDKNKKFGVKDHVITILLVVFGFVLSGVLVGIPLFIIGARKGKEIYDIDVKKKRKTGANGKASSGYIKNTPFKPLTEEEQRELEEKNNDFIAKLSGLRDEEKKSE